MKAIDFSPSSGLLGCVAAAAVMLLTLPSAQASSSYSFATNVTLNGVQIFSQNDILNGLATTNAPIAVTGTNVTLEMDLYSDEGVSSLGLVLSAYDGGSSTATLTPDPGVPPFGINYSVGVGDSSSNSIHNSLVMTVGGSGIWSGTLNFFTASPLNYLNYSAFGTTSPDTSPNFDITLVVVPEPASALALAGMLAPLLVRRRRRG